MTLPELSNKCYWCGEMQHHDVKPPWGTVPWASGRIMVLYKNGGGPDSPEEVERHFSCGSYCFVSMLNKDRPDIMFSNPGNRCSRNMRKTLDQQRDTMRHAKVAIEKDELDMALALLAAGGSS